jgi:hypothetical protein
MMKKLSLLLGTFGLCVALSACGNSNSNGTISDSEAAKGNDVVIESGSEAATESSISSTEELKSQDDNLVETFGISISLPENPNWIKNTEYNLIDENNLKITYYDDIADTDCTVFVANNESLTLPEIEYDESLNESWEGETIDNQNILVTVQHGKDDSKAVLATWEYNTYKFAIMGEDKGSSDSIPKVALNIIYNLK